MTLKEAIYGRRSIRKFKNTEVPDDVIKELLDAAIHAPSACNLQDWKFVVVRNGDRKIFNNSILSQAPVIIVVAYRNDFSYMSGYRHKDYVQSAAAAIENLLLMAYQMGIGGCWICDIPDNQVLQPYFNLPSNYEVLAAVALGYSDEEANNVCQKLFHSKNELLFDSHDRKYSVEECTYYEKYSKGTQRDNEIIKAYEGNELRDFWIRCMLKIACPVLENCSHNTLHIKMPLRGVELGRAKQYAHLEALGRTILGISPWLESENFSSEDEKIQKEQYREWARKSISNAVNPQADDYMNWDHGDQPLVDAAFLCLGVLQAKGQLWDKLEEKDQDNFVKSIKKTRKIAPWRSNWILFSSMIEVFIYEVEGEFECVKSVIDYGISQFEQWYIGDGFYKDGDIFHFDYYESIVIHPFLIEIVNRIPWVKDKEKYIERAVRYCEILNSLIGDDGCYPAIGRSMCYRGGVLHILSKMAVIGALDRSQKKNQKIRYNEVRTSLTNVLNRIMSNKIFDEEGWLRIGVIGEQPALAEEYVTSGSLYMFLAMFMVTAIGPAHIFWSGRKERGFSGRVWIGENLKADAALEGWKH